MTKILFIIISSMSAIFSGCKLEYKHADNDVQGYHWIGVNGNEEIKNDTIYAYNNKLGEDDFTYRIIKNVADTTIIYRNYGSKSDGFTEHAATYKQQLIDNNPYLIIYFESSVSMFTRKRVCPIDFKKIF